ncbi:IS3 family transposase [Paenibacillus sp. TY11]
MYIQKFGSVEDLTQAIHSYIRFYNQERISLT